MVTDVERRELLDALESALGEGPARVMMELLPPVGWSDVARQSDLVAIRGEMAQLRAELKGEMAEVRGEIAELRAELKGEMTEVRGEMAELRAELKGGMAELRGQVQAQLPKFLFANMPVMFGVAGLVLAAAKLA